MTKDNKSFDIAKYIPYEKENAISRKRLSEITGLNDSAMRKEIARARRNTVILNLQDGRGYYRTTNKEEIKRFIKQEEHRAKSIFYNLEGARQELQRLETQMYFADVV